MKKTLILLLTIFVTVFAVETPGVVHVIFDNGEVTTSGDDTFYEFDIQAYITGTSNADDLKIGGADIYVEYDTELFGSSIIGTSGLVAKKVGILSKVASGFELYNLFNSQNPRADVFSLTFEANYTNLDLYDPISTDPNNPSDLYHIKMKAIAAGSGEVSSADARITDAEDQFFALKDLLQYAGPNDFSAAVEPVSIEGPVNGEPFTSIELAYFQVADKGGKVRLRWRTESETENQGFIVKRALAFGEHIGAYEVIDSYNTYDDLIGVGTTSKKTDYFYWDKTVRPGVTYAYVLQDVDYEGHIRECEPVLVTIRESKIISNDKFEFSSSYPNPFNPAFVVPFELYSATTVDIRLYDVTGHLVKIVADREFSAGEYKLLVNGNNLSSGVYLLRTQVEGIVNTQKMLLVK